MRLSIRTVNLLSIHALVEFNLHDIEDCAYVRNFPTGTPIRRHPNKWHSVRRDMSLWQVVTMDSFMCLTE